MRQGRRTMSAALEASRRRSVYVDGRRRILIPPRRPRELPLPGPHLIQRSGVVEPAVLHHEAEGVGVRDVLEWVRVEHEDIGDLPRLQRSERLAEPDRFRAEDRADPQDVVWCHAATRDRPQLPVVAETLELAVTAETHLAAGGDDLRRFARLLLEGELALVEVAVAAQRALDNLRPRHEARELGVARDVVPRVEELLSRRPAEVDEEGRRVGDAAPGDDLDRVLVERRDRVRVLGARVAVDRLREVLLEVEIVL